ncbi:MAG: hypothetical protein KGY50_00030 [Candidatus Thermoplasmatota archaeon]|nr:hypothetical protein [Candidatus Thermoplasmatota archaeon]
MRLKINKKIIGFVLAFLLFSVSTIAIGLTNHKKINNNLTQINHKVVPISFSNPIFDVEDDDLMVTMDGTNSFLNKPGKSRLPCYTTLFAFPIGTRISEIKIEKSKIEKIQVNKPLKIANDPIIAPLGSEHLRFSFNAVESKKMYPTNIFDGRIGRGIKGDLPCVLFKITLYPIRLNSDQSQIEIIDKFIINISYEKNIQANSSSNEGYNFIIITPSKFSEALSLFVDHKINRNISTRIVQLEDIYDGTYFSVQGRDNPEKIKYFIKNAYDEWHIRNVLLVGGDEEVPVRMSHVNVNDWDDGSFVSDLYYADLYNEKSEFMTWDSNKNNLFGEIGFHGEDDEIDLFPDIKIGRWACVDTTEVTSCVNKVVTYENNKYYAADWFSKIGGIGGDTHIGDAEYISEGEYVNEQIFELMGGFQPVRLYASNGKLAGSFPTGTQRIQNMFDEGCGFVNFIGHGATWGFGTHPHNDSTSWLPTPDGHFLTTDVLKLENTKYPIIFTSGCDVGKFYEDDHCFSWSFVSNPHGGGIASCGASAVSYGGGGADATKELVGLMIFNMYVSFRNDKTNTFGEVWASALNKYISANMTTWDYKIVESWEAFADPTLQIAADSIPPLKPEPPSGRKQGSIKEEYLYATKTSDPDSNSIYYKWSWGDETYSEWIGPFDNNEPCEILHRWETKGDYEIRVAAKDTHGSISNWSDPLIVSMPKNKDIYQYQWVKKWHTFLLNKTSFCDSFLKLSGDDII